MIKGLKEHFINLSKHKFIQKKPSPGIILDIVKDSRRWINRRLRKYYKNALEDQNEFERLVYEQEIGLPKNPLMSPVVLSVTTCSNASSSLISNLSVQKIQICEDISHTLMLADSRTISDNISHLSDNGSSRLSRSPLHFPIHGDNSLNLYSHTKNVESEELLNVSFQKSKSNKNSFKNLPMFPSKQMSLKSKIFKHKKSESSNLQTLERTLQNRKQDKLLSLNNSIKKPLKLSQKIKFNQMKKSKRSNKNSLNFGFEHHRGMDSGGSSKIPISFNNRLDRNFLILINFKITKEVRKIIHKKDIWYLKNLFKL